MENKNYLDKILEHLLKTTKIDYEESEVIGIFDYISIYHLVETSNPLHPSPFFLNSFEYSFYKYLHKEFGLTNDESRNLFNQYTYIIKEKISNGQ